MVLSALLLAGCQTMGYVEKSDLFMGPAAVEAMLVELAPDFALTSLDGAMSRRRPSMRPQRTSRMIQAMLAAVTNQGCDFNHLVGHCFLPVFGLRLLRDDDASLLLPGFSCQSISTPAILDGQIARHQPVEEIVWERKLCHASLLAG
jgi:hypothetical protein